MNHGQLRGRVNGDGVWRHGEVLFEARWCFERCVCGIAFGASCDADGSSSGRDGMGSNVHSEADEVRD